MLLTTPWTATPATAVGRAGRQVLLDPMEVQKTHHIDKGEADEKGSYDYFYEYDLYSFSDGGFSLVARSYADEPMDAYFLQFERDGKRHFLGKTDLVSPLIREAIEFLRREGKTSIRYLTAAGYESIESNL
jgi:hypothetical protein